MGSTHSGQSKETDAAWRQGPELESWGHSASRSRGTGGGGINESQVSRVNNGREGVASLLYSPCPSPTFPSATFHCDTGRRSVETVHVAAVSSRAAGPGTAWGYLTPLGLGGCRPAALMARTQPAGPRLREAQQHMTKHPGQDAGRCLSHPCFQDADGEICPGRMR